MKRKFLLFSIFFFVFLFSGICLLYNRDVSAGKPSYRITAVIPHNDTYYWSEIGNALISFGEENSIDVKVEVPQLNYNISQMTQLIKKATAAQVDAIIVQGISDNDYINALRSAASQGIFIVFIDTDIEDFPTHLYVGSDNYNAGIAIGNYIKSLPSPNNHVAILSGKPDYSNLEYRINGITDALASSENIHVETVLYDEFDSQQVYGIYQSLSDEYPSIDTLVCIEGTGGQTLGRLLTADTKKLSHIIVFDRADETIAGIQNGTFDCLVTQNPNDMGRLTIQYLMNYFQNGTLDEWKYYTDVSILTQDSFSQGGHAYDH